MYCNQHFNNHTKFLICLGCVGKCACLVVSVNCPVESYISRRKQGQDLSPALVECEFYMSTDIFSDLYKGASTKEPQSNSLDPSQPGGTDFLSFRPPYYWSCTSIQSMFCNSRKIVWFSLSRPHTKLRPGCECEKSVYLMCGYHKCRVSMFRRCL